MTLRSASLVSKLESIQTVTSCERQCVSSAKLAACEPAVCCEPMLFVEKQTFSVTNVSTFVWGHHFLYYFLPLREWCPFLFQCNILCRTVIASSESTSRCVRRVFAQQKPTRVRQNAAWRVCTYRRNSSGSARSTVSNNTIKFTFYLTVKRYI